MSHAQDFSHHWSLDPTITFLNHGSFGACPVAVLREQRRWRDRMEAEPVRFFLREYPELLDRARHDVARFVGARPENLSFVPSATSGINAVVNSIEFKRGDEIVVTDHEYNACRNVLDAAAARAGARVVTVHLPFPPSSASAIVEAIMNAVSRKTRLILVDHVTSPTALVFPVRALAEALGAGGPELLVDGAHAPGMLHLDLESLGATYWTGNAHKWLCAPKGAAILWVRADRREAIHPAITSHGMNAPLKHGESRHRVEFDWIGTQDVTAYLAVPFAIAFMEGLMHGGWPEIMRRNHALVLEGRRLVSQVLGDSALPAAEMIGSMAAMVLPPAGDVGPTSHFDIDPLQDRLFENHGIEIPVQIWPEPGQRLLRLSAQLYNKAGDYARLAQALREELSAEARASG